MEGNNSIKKGDNPKGQGPCKPKKQKQKKKKKHKEQNKLRKKD